MNTGSSDGTGTMNGVVLYIDDDPDNIFLLQRLFKRKCPGICLHTTMTGGDGVRAAIDERPALILLDNRLPDASGEQVLPQLAAALLPPRSRRRSGVPARVGARVRLAG